MNKGNKGVEDIHKRIYRFVITIIKFTKKLDKTSQNLVIVKQITESATSMGANDQEADGADTRKDFIAKYRIVRKEGKETVFWLNLIKDTNEQLSAEADILINEGTQIVKIVSTIIRNSSH